MVAFISTFAGCGGSSLGYKKAGFKELLAIEWDSHAVETFKLNFDCPVWQRDISTVTSQEILDFCNIKKGELDLLDGSPPCQGFSMSGARQVNDSRNDLFREFKRLINELQPKVFVMENVPGMVKGKMKGYFIEIRKELKSLDYNVKCKLMNAINYGVPQSRERLIFIGIRKDLNKEPVFPEPLKNKIKFNDVFPYLDGMHRGQFDKEIKKHFYTVTKTSSIKFIENGQERKPRINEIKKMCSFPEDFILPGSYNEQWARLGNAVMPEFMYHIAKTIKGKILNV